MGTQPVPSRAVVGRLVAALRGQRLARRPGDRSADAVGARVAFAVVVKQDGIKRDANEFLAAGLIENAGIAASLFVKLSTNADAKARGDCATAGNTCNAFINGLNAQSRKGLDAAIMVGDARTLSTTVRMSFCYRDSPVPYRKSISVHQSPTRRDLRRESVPRGSVNLFRRHAILANGATPDADLHLIDAREPIRIREGRRHHLLQAVGTFQEATDRCDPPSVLPSQRRGA